MILLGIKITDSRVNEELSDSTFRLHEHEGKIVRPLRELKTPSF